MQTKTNLTKQQIKKYARYTREGLIEQIEELQKLSIKTKLSKALDQAMDWNLKQTEMFRKDPSFKPNYKYYPEFL